MKPILPVILCGGTGTRLWPVSRAKYPKQFMRLKDQSTLFSKTIDRVKSVKEILPPLILSNDEYRFYVRELLLEEKISGEVVLEPSSRNTAPAITLAALSSVDKGDPLLLVMPSDQTIQDVDAFVNAVEKARKAADDGLIVTFGISPTFPETGYGYIQRQKDELYEGVFPVRKFTEKPELSVAKEFIASGDYDWNAGIFMFKASVFLSELKEYAPEILESVKNSWVHRENDLSFTRPNKIYSKSPSVSIDYALMERSKKVAVVPVSCGWNDMGSWESFYSTGNKSSDNNVCDGDVIAESCQDSYFRSNGRLIAGIGLNNIAVIETKDAVLVSQRDKLQKVKQVVEKLKDDGRYEFDSHLKIYQPWGNYEQLIVSEQFRVNKITVLPGEETSLHMHYHRAEHWVIVKGTAEVIIDEKKSLLGENQSIYVPLGVLHRIKNPGKLSLELIEVQSGSYINDDDIVRLADDYGRVEESK